MYITTPVPIDKTSETVGLAPSASQNAVAFGNATLKLTNPDSSHGLVLSALGKRIV